MSTTDSADAVDGPNRLLAMQPARDPYGTLAAEHAALRQEFDRVLDMLERTAAERDALRAQIAGAREPLAAYPKKCATVSQ